MLDQLFNLIKGEAQQSIIENPVIPNEHNNTAVGLATESIMSGLQNALANGGGNGLQQILSLFGGRSSVGINNPLVGGIANRFVGSLMHKFGIDSPIAQNIATSLIPVVLSKLVSRTTDPDDNGVDMNGIMSALTGGGQQQAGQGGFDFNGILDAITGGKRVQPTVDQQDNSIGLDDIAKLLTGGGQQSGQGGGDMLNGLLQMVTGGAQQQQQQGQSQISGGIMDLLKGFMK